DHPANSPPSHAKIFRKRVDDDCLLRKSRRGLRRKCVIKPVIDLVRNNKDAGIFGATYELSEGVFPHHGARRIGWRADHDALERPDAMLRQQHLAGDRPACRRIGFDWQRLATERTEYMAIRRIAW